MSSYDALAGGYDGLMADGSYQKRAAFLMKCFRESAIPVRTVLDLACGTGTIACLLAQHGYAVVATDGSEEMLTQAARKAAALERPPLFLHQAMPRLRLAEPVDAVVSTLDSLNYLTREKDLRETFDRVFRWLRPGGRFLFDVNSPCKLRRMDAQMYMDETEDCFCVWRTFFTEKKRICTYQVDLFSRRDDGTWDRNFEEHRERAWTEEELRACLTDAGFAEITVSGDMTRRPPRAEEDRWIITAVRPAEA